MGVTEIQEKSRLKARGRGKDSLEVEGKPELGIEIIK